MFYLICAWTNGWANNRYADDLGRHRAHYDITVLHVSGIHLFAPIITSNGKWQDYVYIQCEYKSTKQKIKHLLREENKVKENKIS